MTPAHLSGVDLRSGLGPSDQVLHIAPSGAQVRTPGTVHNGFQYVTHEGSTAGSPTRDLTVIPAGARVHLLHPATNGFGNANDNGVQGWVSLEFLM